MSNVADKLDSTASQVQWLNALANFYVKDLRALPEDRLTVSPGGCARSPQAITGEVIGLCKYATILLKGQEPSMGENDDSVAALTTHDQLCEAVQSAVAGFSDAIVNASDDVWGKEVTPPWQINDSVRNIVNIAINHIWYHDGQINTYQCLLGDDKIHWMD
jgi:hypothetical protein